MVDIALDAKKHDIIIKDNDMLLIDNAERVAQQIKIQLLTLLGEWFLNVNHGVPYLEYILVKKPNPSLIRQIFREQILSVNGVTDVSIKDLEYDVQYRKMTLEYEAATDYGLVTKREVLGYGR